MARAYWPKKTSVQIMAVLFFALPSCSVNILKTFGDPLTNEALLYDAKMLINDGDYSGALAKFAAMSPAFLALDDTRVVHASAYAGVCGLDFMQLMTDLGNIGSARVLEYLMQKFPSGTAARRDACIAAEAEIQAIDPSAVNRTVDQNMLIAMIAFAKIGVILSKTADTAAPIGTADPAFDPCLAGSLSVSEAKHVATGVFVILDALNHVGGSTIGGAAMTTVNTACASLGGFCSNPETKVTTGSISGADEKMMRSLIYEGASLGLDTDSAPPSPRQPCGGQDVTMCFCP